MLMARIEEHPLRLSGFDGRSKIPPDLILGKFGIVLPHAAQKCPTPKGH
jgi:hypothetical protein